MNSANTKALVNQNVVPPIVSCKNSFTVKTSPLKINLGKKTIIENII